MTDKLQIICSQHKKVCTDYCMYDDCQKPDLFICPRCIQKKINHSEHKDFTKDISNITAVSQLIQDIMMNNSECSYDQEQLQQMRQLNDYFINTLTLLNEEISRQITLKLQNQEQLIDHIIAQNKILNESSIKSSTLTQLIKNIQEKRLFDNRLYKEMKTRLDFIYQPLGKQLQKFQNSIENDIQEMAIQKQEDILKQSEFLTLYQNKFLKQQKELVNNELIIKQEENLFNKAESDQSVSESLSFSEKEDSSLSKIVSEELYDLFNSQVNSKQPKKYMIQNPGMCMKQNQSSQKNNKQACLQYKSDSDQFEERKINNQQDQNAYSKSDGEYELKMNKGKGLKGIQMSHTSLLNSFNPQLQTTEALGDVQILSINIQAKIILLTYNQLPSVLQLYSINHHSVNRESNIVFTDGTIIDAVMSEDMEKIVVASPEICRIYNVQNGENFALKTNPEKLISKIELDKNDQTIIVFEDYSFEIYQHNNTLPFKKWYFDQQQTHQNSYYFFKLIEDSISLQLRQNKCLQLFDMINYSEIQNIKEKYSLNSIEISQDRRIIATSGVSENVTIYQYNNKKKDFDFINKIETGHNDEILQTKLINKDTWIVTISGDCTWKVYDVKSAEMIYIQSSEQQNAFIKCEFFPQDNTLVFIDQYGELKIYKLI